MCRVANIRDAVFGPNASGVISVFPSPTTKYGPVGNISLIVRAISFTPFLKTDMSIAKFGSSKVMYLPIGFPMRFDAKGFSMLVTVLVMPLRSYVCVVIPFILAPSQTSSAKSLLKYKKSPHTLLSCPKTYESNQVL
jgi:hypothetical protein